MDAPIGKSDHCILNITINCGNHGRTTPKMMYIYDKGNYEEIRLGLSKVNWETQLGEHGLDIDQQWNVFKMKCLELEERYIPKRQFRMDRKGKRIPLDKSVLEKIKKKTDYGEHM